MAEFCQFYKFTLQKYKTTVQRQVSKNFCTTFHKENAIFPTPYGPNGSSNIDPMAGFGVLQLQNDFWK